MKTEGTPAKRPSPWMEWKISAIRMGSAERGGLGRKWRGGHVGCGIGNASQKKGFPPLDASSAGATVEETPFVAGPGSGVVDFQFRSPSYDGRLIHGDKGAEELDAGVGS